MAAKTATASSEERSSSIKRQERSGGGFPGGGTGSGWSGGMSGGWNRMTQFLSDVRSEMRKVVAPSRKEVESTTAVVIATVFLFGLFFWATDLVFSHTVQQLLHKLSGGQ